MLKARTKLACNIAGIDPARFNELVHFNKYPCAPDTTPGSARVFDVDDIIALRIHVMLTDIGMSQEGAGHIACNVLRLIQNNPEAEVVSYLKASNGKGHFAAQEVNADRRYDGFPDKSLWLSFCIKDHRAFVVAHLNEEASILGSE
ncbi:MAG: hypothetical protein ACK4GO_09450 [Gemmobacter sp.]